MAKVLAVLSLAHQSGMSLRQGVALGVALVPMSSVALLLTLETGAAFPDFASGLGLALMSCIVILELAGPILVQVALRRAGRNCRKEKNHEPDAVCILPPPDAWGWSLSCSYSAAMTTTSFPRLPTYCAGLPSVHIPAK